MFRDYLSQITRREWIFIFIAMVFVCINSILILQEFFWFGLLSLGLMVGLAFIYAPDRLLIFISFLTPIAVNLSDFEMQLGLSIPTEPLLALLMLLILAKFLYDHQLDKKILLHPLSVSIYLYFFWMFITVFTSSQPLVSVKWTIAKMWFLIPIYFFGSHVFKNPRRIWQFINAHIAGFVIVIIYTLIHHAINGFTSESGHWVMTPFYNDHTSYGAMLAFFIPYLTLQLFRKDLQGNIKIVLFALFSLFILALVLSISRAAWASVLFAFGLWFLIRFKIKFKWILSATVVLVFLLFAYQSQIMIRLEKNKQDAKGGLVEHVESVSNVATDASNLERINRWSSAVRMFKERPLFGWGPGTYQFVYAPFQRSYEKTVISTNSGTQGTAHSEYLLILSEEGIPGLLTLLLIFSFIVSIAIRNHHKLKDSNLKLLNLALLLGLSTYLAHAVFNNFLDTDKAAVPFWGFVAGITALSVYGRNQESSDSRNASHIQ